MYTQHLQHIRLFLELKKYGDGPGKKKRGTVLLIDTNKDHPDLSFCLNIGLSSLLVCFLEGPSRFLDLILSKDRPQNKKAEPSPI